MMSLSTHAVGKKVGQDLYLHLDVVQIALDEVRAAAIGRGIQRLDAEAARRVNVVKLRDDGSSLSLLAYPNFQNDPFPALAESWTCHCDGRVVFRTYRESLNPPILHRKELLVPLGWPGRDQWVGQTELAESIGLFDETSTIGFRMNWERRVAALGYQIEDGRLVALSNDGSPSPIDSDQAMDSGEVILRHRTALSRSALSAPVQALLRHDLLASGVTLFDYGCGRGDDIATLIQEGYTAKGWDPYFAASSPIESADLVNLGFVVNVIEDPAERVEAIQSAFRIADRALIVSVMLHGAQVTGIPWRDGYRTQRDTFQKYFSQDEFRDYLELVLQRPVNLVAPGIALVFKDNDWEQRYLLRKHRRVRVAEWLLQRERTGLRRVRPAIDRAPKESKLSKEQALLVTARPTLDQLWVQALDLGRVPEPEESSLRAEVESVAGSWSRCIGLLQRHYDHQVLADAARVRRDDMLVFLVVQLFQKRKPYKTLEPRLQRDVRAFFGSYDAARSDAAQLLRQTADPAAIATACQEAAERGLGHLEHEQSLHVQAAWVDRLPAALRAYVACAQVLWSDTDTPDVVKIHIDSGKVTLLTYEDFHTSPLPRLKRRVKVNLRKVDYDLFEYGTSEHPAPYLYWKSQLLNEESPDYSTQLAFDEQLAAIGVEAGIEFGPPPESLARTLSLHRLAFDGSELRPSQTIPDLDQLTGRVFRYRDLIECGETQRRLLLPNVPLNPATYNALHALCVQVLDPVVEYFGRIRLTYGFSSHALARQINGRIAPDLDQHAGCEVGSRDRAVCSRGGAAVDFIIDDEDMREVAEWIIANTPFDRLYFYGLDRPLHVSFGPENSRAAFEMVTNRSGARTPRPFRRKT